MNQLLSLSLVSDIVKLDEKFQIKSSMCGWLFTGMSESSIFGWLLHSSLYREADVTYNHPILDDSIHPILDVAYFFHYWMLYIIIFWMKLVWHDNHPLLNVTYFLDEKYMKKRSSVIGWFLPSLSGWNLYSTIIIHCWT